MNPRASSGLNSAASCGELTPNEIKTIGCATMHHEIEKLEQLAKQEIDRLSGNQQKLSANETNEIIEQAFSLLSNSSIRSGS